MYARWKASMASFDASAWPRQRPGPDPHEQLAAARRPASDPAHQRTCGQHPISESRCIAKSRSCGESGLSGCLVPLSSRIGIMSRVLPSKQKWSREAPTRPGYAQYILLCSNAEVVSWGAHPPGPCPVNSASDAFARRGGLVRRPPARAMPSKLCGFSLVYSASSCVPPRGQVLSSMASFNASVWPRERPSPVVDERLRSARCRNSEARSPRNSAALRPAMQFQHRLLGALLQQPKEQQQHLAPQRPGSHAP